jgi:hypothetical protein
MVVTCFKYGSVRLREGSRSGLALVNGRVLAVGLIFEASTFDDSLALLGDGAIE